MNWQKNRFSYFLWLVYTTIVGIGTLGIASIVCTRMGYISDYGLLTGGGYLLVVGMLVFCLRKLLVKKKFAGLPEGMTALVTENIIVIALFAVGIVLRVMHISNMSSLGEDSYFYELAKVTEGQGVPLNAHGATYFYLRLLNLVLLIFGNKIAAAVWLQVMLQMAAAVLLYMAVRKLAGRMAAVILVGFVMCTPYMVEQAVTLSPMALFLVIYGLALGCMAHNLPKHDCKLWNYLLVGIIIGICCYLDISGVSLLAIAAGVISLEREEPENVYNKGVIVFLIFALGSIASVLLLILLNSAVSGCSIVNIFGAWGKMYQPEGFVLPASLYQLFQRQEGILLVAVLVIGIFSYGRREEYERQSIWQGAVLLLIALHCFQITHPNVDAAVCTYILLAVLAGVGLEGIFIMDDKPKHFVDELEEKLAKEEAMKVKATQPEPKKDASSQTDAGETKNNAQVASAVNDAQEKKIKPGEITVENLNETSAESEKTKVKLLDNPLPGPKKHVPKVMDYKVRELDLKNVYEFDIQVSDDDDFDI